MPYACFIHFLCTLYAHPRHTLCTPFAGSRKTTNIQGESSMTLLSSHHAELYSVSILGYAHLYSLAHFGAPALRNTRYLWSPLHIKSFGHPQDIPALAEYLLLFIFLLSPLRILITSSQVSFLWIFYFCSPIKDMGCVWPLRRQDKLMCFILLTAAVRSPESFKTKYLDFGQEWWMDICLILKIISRPVILCTFNCPTQ